ncbi:Deoxyguanosinetriphosphate triphosphohydrolase-like protein [Streptomyces fumanus]
MDWSDDVAYSVHDVEDGLHAGHIDPACLLADPERRAVFEVAAARYAPADTDPGELAEALDRLLAQDWWPHGYDGAAIAQARLKDATSQLIGRFCLAAERATRAAYGGGRLTRYTAELVVPRATRMECAVLKAVADRYVMQRAEQERLRADQQVVVLELAGGADPPGAVRAGPAVPGPVRPGAGRPGPQTGARRPDRLPHRRLGPFTARAADLIGPLPLPGTGSVRDARMWRNLDEEANKWSTLIRHSSSSEEGWPARRRPRPSARRVSPAG